MNQHVKNQHYVPQFLLKNFSSRSGRFIWTYFKDEKIYNSNRIRERAIRKVASEQYFYDEDGEDVKDSFEYKLKESEDNASLIIAKLIKTKDLKSLEIDEKKNLAYFITLQHLRTKGQLNKTEKTLDYFSDQLLQKANIKIPQINSRDIWLSLLKQSISIKEILLNKVWMLSESNNSYLISDNPVTLQNSTDKTEIRGKLGLDSFGIEIYLPLSPSITLCLFCEKLFEKNNFFEKNIPNLHSSPEGLLNLNAIQIHNAERFIFSSKNEFSLVKKILER